MNRVILIGRLTKEADVRNNGEMQIARFTVAVDRQKKGEADFINCVAFKKTADIVEKYFGKGSKIALEGHIQTGSYAKQDGTKVYTTDVIVDSVEFVESKSDAKTEPPVKNDPTPNDFMNLDSQEGLPFE